MTINAVKTIEFENDGSKLTVDATTQLPATPTLLIFCCGYRLLPKKTKRGGQDVPHGNLLYLDCVPQMFDPVETGGTEFHWEVDNADYVPGCDNCHLAIVELATKPKVDWTTQVYECPPVPVGAVHFNGAVTFATGSLDAPDSSVFSVSQWYRLASDQSGPTWWTTDFAGSGHTLEFFGPGNIPAVLCMEGDPHGDDPGRLDFGSGGATGLNEWHHVGYAANVAPNGSAKFAVVILDGVDVTEIFQNFGEGFAIGTAGRSWVLGGDGFGNNTTVDSFDLWIAYGQFVDFADPDVLALFRTPDGKPVDLGEHGELPTGTAPTIFGHGGAADFLQPNLGTGGPLTLAGALSDTDGPSM